MDKKLKLLGEDLGNNILFPHHTRNPSRYFEIMPKVKVGNNEHIRLLAEHANNAFASYSASKVNLTEWTYQWLMVGYNRAQKIINNCNWDGAYIYEETLNTIETNLFFTETWYINSEVKFSFDFDRCTASITPFNKAAKLAFEQ